jgi:hypothetical protein
MVDNVNMKSYLNGAKNKDASLNFDITGRTIDILDGKRVDY